MKRSRISLRRNQSSMPGEILELRLNLSPLMAAELETEAEDFHPADERGSELPENDSSDHQRAGYASVRAQEEKNEQEPEQMSSFVAAPGPTGTSSNLWQSFQESGDDAEFESVKETSDWEDREQSLEHAHNSGTQVVIEDHQVDLLDEVIPHVAEQLLVDRSDLESLIVRPSPTGGKSSGGAAAPSGNLTTSPNTGRQIVASESVDEEVLLDAITRETMTVYSVSIPARESCLFIHPDGEASADIAAFGIPAEQAVPVWPAMTPDSFVEMARSSASALAESSPKLLATVEELLHATEDSLAADIMIQSVNAAGLLPVPMGVYFGPGLALLNQGVQMVRSSAHGSVVSDATQISVQGMETADLVSVAARATLLAAGLLSARRIESQYRITKLVRRIGRKLARKCPLRIPESQ